MYNIAFSSLNQLKKDLCYLAIPYSWNPEKAFEIANVVAKYCFDNGVPVFSPVSHGHPINLIEGNSINYETWVNFDLKILLNCHSMILVYYGIDGAKLIKQSLRYQREIEFCQEHGIPIFPCTVTDK